MSEQTRLDKSLLIRALMEFSGRSNDQVTQFLAGMPPRKLRALRNSPKVRPIYERLESEGRLLYDRWWLDDAYSYNRIPFEPRGMPAFQGYEIMLSQFAKKP